MRHSFIDRYAVLDSPIHILEARTKIIGFTALIVAVLFIPPGRDGILFSYCFLVAVLMGLSQIPLGYVMGRGFLLLPFVLMAGLAVPWSDGRWAGLAILLLRSFLCLLLLILMTNTTRFTELLRGLRRLGVPKIIVLNLGFLYRYLFVLTEEVMRMKLARDCRSVKRSRFAAELRVVGSMLGTLLLRSFERSESMYQAMLSRGYEGEFPVHGAARLTWRDLAVLAALSAIIGATFAI